MLRRALSGRTLEEAALAIFDPSGRCLHWDDESNASDGIPFAAARVRLKRDLRASFEQTGNLRAFELWSALCAGRMLLVDHTDVDGRKRIVLLPVPSPGSLPLTSTERRVAELAGQGRANKEIAHQVRISETAVENHLSRAMRKLRIRTRIDLVRVYTRCEGRLPSSDEDVGP